MYRTANTSMGVFGIISIILFWLSLETEIKILVTLSYVFVGFASFPALTVSYPYCSEVTFPINEATASGLLQLPLQFTGFGLTVVLTEIIELWKESNQGVLWSMLTLCICTLIGTTAAALMKPLPKQRYSQLKDKSYNYDANAGM